MKRSQLQRRTPLRARPPALAPRSKQYEGGPITPRTSAPSYRTIAGALCAPTPKPVAARPGKRTPTAEERRWMDAITSYGCIACRIDGRGFVPAAVHHILRGGQRIGHLFTLPLCDPGHHQNGQMLGVVSRHPWKTRFEAIYGAELDLLAELQQALRPTPAHSVVKEPV